jgi:hypothetical protein
MLTANRLGDGAVVYLAEGGRWVEVVGGTILRDDASTRMRWTQAMLPSPTAGDRPYQSKSKCRQRPAPISVRERIRADRGPTFAIDAGSWTGRIKD